VTLIPLLIWLRSLLTIVLVLNNRIRDQVGGIPPIMLFGFFFSLEEFESLLPVLQVSR